MRGLAEDSLRCRRAPAFEQDTTERDERRGRRPERLAPGQALRHVPQQALRGGVATGPMELGCARRPLKMTSDVSPQRHGYNPG